MRIFFQIVLLVLFSVTTFSQEHSADFKKKYNNAIKDFDEERFEAALSKFIHLDSIKPDDFEIKYYIGASYLNTKYDKVKGIPYLEFAGQKGEKFLPKDVFRDLGTLYHLNYEFDKAIYQFQKYLSITEKDDSSAFFATHMIQVCNNAKDAVKNSNIAGIINLEKPLNSEQNETNPYVSADEGVMYFTRDYVVSGNLLIKDSVSEILTSVKVKEIWSYPKALSIDLKQNEDYISIAGVSPDGEQLYVLFKDSNQTDIYSCYLSESRCKNLTKLGGNINSEYNEGACSITPDGQIIYFSSSRPGGFGGKDLYRSLRDEKGGWAEPQNLGPEINTAFDEDAPFIHPDMQTIYFSSSGHNTMGGYDIFKSFYEQNLKNWISPQNLGYPINTTGDDINFVLSADGKYGYFSSNQGSKYNTYDIFKVKLDRSIPLTMVKGIISSGNPPVPLKAQIKVFDVEKNERIKYVYNPDKESGKYLMIFPPGKNYNMLIEAENYLPHLLNIYIPEQNYFYELFQEIHLTPIGLNKSGEAIGEQISVKNLFYNLNAVSDSSFNEDTLKHRDYTKLLKLIEELIQKTDSIGIETLDKYSRGIFDESSDENFIVNKNYQALLDKIETAIETSDSLSLEKLGEETLFSENTSQDYIYNDGSNKDSIYTFIIGRDTIKALAPIYLSSGSEKNNSHENNGFFDVNRIKNSAENNRYNIFKTDVLFMSGSYSIPDSCKEKLDDIARLLNDNKKIGVEIKGFSDSSGDTDDNQKLSELRAKAVKIYFINKKVNSEKILIKAYGESMSSPEYSESEKQYNRRSEIHIFTVKD